MNGCNPNGHTQRKGKKSGTTERHNAVAGIVAHTRLRDIHSNPLSDTPKGKRSSWKRLKQLDREVYFVIVSFPDTTLVRVVVKVILKSIL